MAPTKAEKLIAEAEALEAKAKGLRDQVSAAHREALLAKPLNDRLTYAAHARCDCGAGMAYDPAAKGDPTSPLMLERSGPRQWECSDILRFETYTSDQKLAVKAATHTSPLPFALYEVKSENQPSANGATTRERVPQPESPAEA